MTQFGRELCEEQTQKIRNPDKKITFWGLWRCEMGLRARNPQQAHAWLVLNPYNKFQALYYIYIPNFRVLAQFGRELCEEQTQKIRNPDKKMAFLGLWGCGMGLRDRNLQKALAWPVLNFQRYSSIRRRVMRRTNSKLMETNPQNHILGLPTKKAGMDLQSLNP